ncbi:MAG: carbohydrate ABC transporter permease [Oscillospiraceae bacterium]|jgi:putative aldouronate transport system permease protein|nr:carbohydrate ABC transporter permease [Oscillospiraceae bacterium]
MAKTDKLAEISEKSNTRIKETTGRIAFKIFNTVLMVIIAFVCLAPLLHVLFASVSNPTLLTQYKGGIILWPLYDAAHSATLKGYSSVLANSSLIRGYANTFFYVGTGTVLSVIFSAIGGYCISRRNTLWMKYLVIMMTITMFFAGGIVPTFMINKALGIVNTRWVMIVMGLMSFFNMIIVRTAFQAIPASLEESAQLDGAGHLTILFKISFPLAKATMAVIALFYAVGKWNEYITAQIYLTDRALYPLQIILREIIVQSSGTNEFNLSDQGNYSEYKKLLQYSTIIFATLPILCMYPFVQKYFVKGVMIGSIKG